MADGREQLLHKLSEPIATGKTDDAIKIFSEALGPSFDAAGLFNEANDRFVGQELALVLAEVVAAINAACDADEFHNWDYDHLEFIIELFNRRKLTIPRNLLNGLPEQLIILVNKERLADAGCNE